MCTQHFHYIHPPTPFAYILPFPQGTNLQKKWSNGKMEKAWKPFSPQNNLMQDSERNEEHGYPAPDSNKIKINAAKKPNNAHRNNLREETRQVITENFMEMLLDMVNQNV
jgi:hypothetical protein